MQLITLVSLVFLASSSGWSPSCVTDPSEFDFDEARPPKFAFGTHEEVTQAYKRLVDVIGNPRFYSKPNLFHVTGAYTRFTRYECAGAKCNAMDFLESQQRCSYGAQSSADVCYPIAAVYNSKLYCLLEPSHDDANSREPFHPYE